MKRLNSAFDMILPGFERLREDANADVVLTELEPGLVAEVPWYQQDIGEPELIDEQPFVTHSGRELGFRAVYSTLVDGIGYEAHLRIPYDELRHEHEYLDFISTAWMTQPGSGYTDSPNARIFANTLMPQVDVGPPASDRAGGIIGKLFKVPALIAKSSALPLSYTAQAEQGIVAKIAEVRPSLRLPTQQVKRGKSRGANLSSGHVPYAAQHGAEIIAMMNMGRCAPDKITVAEIPEFVAWLTMTGLGGVAASACLLKDGQFRSLKGTTSLRPDFLAANLTGTMRALASGETGEMIDWTPRGMYGSEVLYGLDSLSRVETTSERLADRNNLRKKIVPGGTHAALLHPLAHSGENERMKRFSEQFQTYKGQLALMDHDYIYGVTDPSLFEEAVA